MTHYRIPPPRTLIIGCGALAREMVALKRANGWSHMDLACLPADLHNRPARIPEAVRGKIRAARGHYDHMLVLYGDCGTGGKLDAVLRDEGVERISGAHCYEFYAGATDFAELAEREPGTFFLTDYLVRHFDRLIIAGLGLDRYPQLLGDYFGNYRLLVHLAQVDDAALDRAAEAAARRLGLAHERRFTGLQGLARFLGSGSPEEQSVGETHYRLLA
jgi:hypothetical protein